MSGRDRSGEFDTINDALMRLLDAGSGTLAGCSVGSAGH